MEPTLDQVRQELADIHDQLLEAPEDAFDQRAILKDRQNELRQLSARLVEGEPLHDAGVLRAAYTRLQSVRDRLVELHVSHSGIEGSFTTVVNKAIDAGMGLDEVEARLQEILRQMKSTG